MVKGIKSFLKVYKDTTSKADFIAGLLNFICYINDSLIGGYFSTKTILFFKSKRVFSKNYKVSYELIFRLAYLGSRFEKLDDSCCTLGYLLFQKTGIIFAIFNRSGKTPVEKERLIRYVSGFAIT